MQEEQPENREKVDTSSSTTFQLLATLCTGH